MVATPLPTYTRYFPPGTRKVYWVPSIANPAAPTRTELNAGTDLTGQVAAISGFTLPRDVIDVTPLGSQFTVLVNSTIDVVSQINEIILFATSASNDARFLIPTGTVGFVVFLFEGDITSQFCEVWPANVNTFYFEQDMETPGEIHFQFTITALPSQNVPIP